MPSGGAEHAQAGRGDVAVLDSSPEDAAQVASDILEQAPTGEYPYLTELTTERVLQGDCHFGDEFEVGLDLLLDSLERAIER
ncbi:hypothetical protein CIW52_01200 [Mycolicibacterium sp. P9-64]|nr:hypothetical protein CIW52_01200 [Mycolicibacterium sp. P9-64]